LFLCDYNKDIRGIDFSGVERFIDTPVKRYSSGMYVRLAFAVAAHLESEILIVDEVLAVGDAEFQKKCLGKMGAISKGQGRTVLFVSHNMAAISELCPTSILLNNGKIFDKDLTPKIIDLYVNSGSVETSGFDFDFFKKGDLLIIETKSDVNYEIYNGSFFIKMIDFRL
jgi:lipopolysaccharide transport system ATP-binding protein